jgi:hypothetical protein
MDIQRETLPDHPVSGEQWVLVHHVPTHDMALAVSEAVMEFAGTARALRLQTVVVTQLVEDWHVFDFEGKAIPFADGTGIGSAPQATVQRVFKICEPIAQRVVNPDDEETPAPNRAARRAKARA